MKFPGSSFEVHPKDSKNHPKDFQKSGQATLNSDEFEREGC